MKLTLPSAASAVRRLGRSAPLRQTAVRVVWALSCLAASACNDPTGPTTEINGQQIYEQYCARCHGFDGSGVPDQPAAQGRLNNLAIMSSRSDQQVMGVIRAGKPPAMPGFAGEFTDAKLRVLTAYVRSLSLPGPAPAAAPTAE